MFIGHTHQLRVSSLTFDTVWLDASDHGSLSLPLTEAPDSATGDTLSVFIYTDSAARACATTAQPLAALGECACLTATASTDAGTFLDWGMEKELLLPYAEQRRPLNIGQRESVLVYLDNSGRLAATSRLDHHLSDQPAGFSPWQAVSMLVYQRTDLGFKAVIDHCAIGLLYKDEVFQPLRVGDRLPGFIKRIRADGRIDLSTQTKSKDLQADLTERIIKHLEDNAGVSSLTDKSPPDAIYAAFKVSKKNFKKALGVLYRQRRITIEADKVTLL
jgi:predicted RNA-binding protein (virulence factor B family)